LNSARATGDYLKAVLVLRETASRGALVSQELLGNIYYLGLTGAADFDQAIKGYEMASKKSRRINLSALFR
jgi:TPR repeat protein